MTKVKIVLGSALAAILLLGMLPAAGQDGMIVVRDAQTGQLRAATPAEIRALQQQAPALQPGQRASGPSVLRADGTRHVHMSENAQTYSVATRNADGSITRKCVHGEQATPAKENSHE
jgi:hypothetical protein